MKKFSALVLVLMATALVAATRPPIQIFTEPFVRHHTLPDVLAMEDGRQVGSAKMWREQRRPELLELFRSLVYGRMPGRPDSLTFEVFDEDRAALGGKAVRKQVRVNFLGDEKGPGMDLLIYLPAKAPRPVPVFVNFNFRGNHSIHPDPAIRLCSSWITSAGEGVVDNHATEAGRGTRYHRFPVEQIIARGYGLATAYYGDIDPDFGDGFKNGVHGALDPPGPRPADAWGSVAAWAWGLRRAMDYLETDPDVDPKKVMAAGHSRLAKTALWAGAEDQRFAMVFASGSGCMGASIGRRLKGEDIVNINTQFPHWFCENFKSYNLREDDLPVDQHELLALMAPRPVYLSAAEYDFWADPLGEFEAAKAAAPVFELLGAGTFPAKHIPNLHSPIKGAIGFHIRSGRHDLTAYDWEGYIDFADLHMIK